MGFFVRIQQILPGETLISNSFLYLNHGFFIFIFSNCLILVKTKFLKQIKNKTIYKILPQKKNNFFKSIFFLHSKLKYFVGSLFNLKYTNILNKKEFYLRTNNNSLYFLSHFCFKKFFLYPNHLLIIKGKKNLGYKKIWNFGNFLKYFICLNFIILEISYIFPYSFSKYLKIFKGIKIILKINFHPLVFSCSTDSGFFYIWIIKKNIFKNKIYFSQCGKFFFNGFYLISFNMILSRRKILLGISDSKKFATLKISFDKKKKFSYLFTYGFVSCSSNNSIISLFWGGIFSKCFFTGNSNGKIIIWNELLFPLFKIKNSGFFILDFKISDDFSAIILILKKKKNFKKNKFQNKFQTILPQSILKIFSFEKIFFNKCIYVINKFYFLRKKNTWTSFKKIFKMLKEIQNFFSKIFFVSFFNKLCLLTCDTVEKKLSSFFDLKFFYKICSIFFSKSFKFILSYNSSLRRIIFKRLFLISKKRKFSNQEIQEDQQINLKIFKKFFFKKCIVCDRISKFFFLKKKNTCLFFHYISKKSLNLTFYQSNFLKRNSFLDLKDGKKKPFFLKSLEISFNRKNKKIRNQKEFTWNLEKEN